VPSLRSRRVVLPDGVRPATIHHSRGVIVEIDEGAADDDFGDLVVMPGLVDSHVHVNEPGRTGWEGFRSATRAAAAGGTTTVVDMPLNSIPPTVDRPALVAKRAAAENAVMIDVAFWGGLIPGSEGEIGGLVADGVCGFKAFLVDSGVPEFPPMTLPELRKAMPTLTDLGVPLLLHAEDPAQLHEMRGDPRSYRGYLASRPASCEAEAVELAAGLSDEGGGRVHVLHVSSADSVDVLRRKRGASIGGETCPHYLTFTAEEIDDGSTQFKCAPPIRTREHREALWEGLGDGSLQMVVSDHSPAPADLKAVDTGDFSLAWGGISSLQVRLPATWTGAERRGFGLDRLTEWLAAAPAELAGLDGKGAIEAGKDADFVVWDPDGVTEVDGDTLEHRHPLTPYQGLRLRGRVEETILSGNTVFARDGIRSGEGKLLVRG
jgi:allantoinase